ncbi:hypothetical protein MKW98_020202 [Papaver atlanticum]|uniref:NAC domain-containing protein n=1 Tax=Papaver atlanticum TaxID=357466 RepID=A0AAD4S9A2_9MAGN|nr:hypothetical protein MKW98_020202 [Papaver atlanticum]
MGLRDIEATMPPGFRFYPNDEELVCHYLYQKINGSSKGSPSMVEVDLQACEPWQLPDVAKLGATVWYFFSYRERKYSIGCRTNRATASGYWKATGKDKPVYDPTTFAIVGMRKTLVFYRDRAPNGIKTEWVMHEFRLESQHLPPKDWVLCRVFDKSKGDSNTEIASKKADVFGITPYYPKLLASPSAMDCCHHSITMQPGEQQLVTSSFSSSEIPYYHQCENSNPNNSLINLSAANFNIPNTPVLEFLTSEENNIPLINTTNPRNCDDQYGFLCDKYFEDYNFVD